MMINELRRLAFEVEPITGHEAPLGREPEVRAFNDAVSKFRELVVSARNQLVCGQSVSPEVGREIRILSETLPGERARLGGRGRGGAV
jgi:hypothetical protein